MSAARPQAVGASGRPLTVALNRAWADLGPPAAAIALILAVWQLSGLFLNPILLSTPAAVARELVSLGTNVQIWVALGQSLEEMAIGLILGLIVGIALLPSLSKSRQLANQ